MVVVLSIAGGIWLLMMAALVRYFLLPVEKQGAFRSDPGQHYGLSRGERTLRAMMIPGLLGALIVVIYRPRRGESYIVGLSELNLTVLAACAAASGLGISALFLRRIIYKRWI